jgi:hypothetical protein
MGFLRVLSWLKGSSGKVEPVPLNQCAEGGLVLLGNESL